MWHVFRDTAQPPLSPVRSGPRKLPQRAAAGQGTASRGLHIRRYDESACMPARIVRASSLCVDGIHICPPSPSHPAFHHSCSPAMQHARRLQIQAREEEGAPACLVFSVMGVRTKVATGSFAGRQEVKGGCRHAKLIQRRLYKTLTHYCGGT